MEFQNLNILILDDDERIREELSEFLTRRKSVVFSAGCPSSAFYILKHNQIDLLFLDFALPEMDGLLVLKKVLSMYPRLKVIMISGTGNSNLAIQAKEKGAVEFLRKPFLHYEVKKALEKLPNIKKNKNKIRHQTNKRSKKKRRNYDQTNKRIVDWSIDRFIAVCNCIVCRCAGTDRLSGEING